MEGQQMSGRYDCPHCGVFLESLADYEAELNLASATIHQLKEKLAAKTDAHDKDGKEVVRLNGVLIALEESAREAGANEIADMIVAMRSINPRGIKSDAMHMDPVDDLHVEGLDDVLKNG